MKKIIVLIILLIGLSVQAVVIKGGVHYTVESAREEAFSKVRYTIPMDEHKKYLTDPGFSLDKNGKPKIRKFGRRVCFFESDIYSIARGDYNYYFDKNNGKLVYLEYEHIRYSYPNLSAKYTANGELIELFFNIMPHQTFVYDKNQKFLGRWIDDSFYDENGLLVNKRFVK